MYSKSNFEKFLSLNSITSEADLIKPLRRRSSNASNQIDFKNEDQVFQFFLACLKKAIRSTKENQIIMLFLKKMNEFLNLIKNSHENTADLLGIISSCLGYHNIPANKILFRIGDKGDKFYIILKGKISILILKEINLMMSEEEYFNFIQKLIIFGETHILNLCLNANDNIYTFASSNSPRRRYTRRSLNNNLTLTYNETNRNLELYNVTEYIENLKPKIVEGVQIERKEVKVWVYLHFISLSKGEYFGDAALTCIDQKRTATIFTEEECHFGVLNKESYDKCIKEANENQKLSNVNFLLSTNIFSEFSQKYFKLHYLNFFKKMKISIYEKLIIEGQIPVSTYIIKEGEFEISFRKSLVEINEYLKHLGQIDEFEIEEEKTKMNDNPRFMKFMQDRKLYRISIVKSKEVVGLEDLIFNKKYGFTVECLSSESEIYKIENKILNMFCEKEVNLRMNIENLINKKSHFILDRLKKIKFSRLDFFSKNFENDYILTPCLSSRMSSVLSSIHSPITNSYCRIEKPKLMDEKTCQRHLDKNKLKEDPTNSRNKTKIPIKIKKNIEIPALIIKSPNQMNNDNCLHISEGMPTSRTNIEDDLKFVSRTVEENSVIFDDSFLQNKYKKRVKDIENTKNKIKIIKNKFKIISDKLDKEKKITCLNMNKNTSEQIIKSFSKKDISNFDQKENGLGFVNEYKLINEFVKTSKNHFNDHLYQRISSNYFSDQYANKSKDSINVVDCLALDNFNRIYSKASLPIIGPNNVKYKKNILMNEYKQKDISKIKHIYITKNKLINNIEKSGKGNSTYRSIQQRSTLQIFQKNTLNKEESLQSYKL